LWHNINIDVAHVIQRSLYKDEPTTYHQQLPLTSTNPPSGAVSQLATYLTKLICDVTDAPELETLPRRLPIKQPTETTSD